MAKRGGSMYVPARASSVGAGVVYVAYWCSTESVETVVAESKCETAADCIGVCCIEQVARHGAQAAVGCARGEQTF